MRKLLWTTIALAIVLASALPVFAQGDGDGKVVFGGSFTLESGDTLGDDLIVLGGAVTIEEESLLDGDLVVLGGSASVAGEISGNAVVFGGRVELKDTALIEGELANFGAALEREEGATIRGGETVGPLAFDFAGPWSSSRWQRAGARDWAAAGGRTIFGIIWGVIQDIGRAVILTILGLLIVLFWPGPSERVGSAAVAKPLPSLGVGILSLVVAFCVGLILLIAACSGLLVWLAAAVAWIFGWTAVGLMVGQRILEAFKVESTPPLATIVGVAAISLIWASPCLGNLFALIVGAAGLGAVVLTRAGTRPYPLPTILPPSPEESLAIEE
jgi:hypothetical protein